MSAVTEYFRDEGRRQCLEKGRAEGRKEGIEIGIKKEKEQRDIEIAIIMIKNNEPVEKIALYWIYGTLFPVHIRCYSSASAHKIIKF